MPSGESINACVSMKLVKYLPEGCFLKHTHRIYLNSLIELPEGCTIKAPYVNLESLKKLPENYLVDSENVICSIILPSYKSSPEFHYGSWGHKKSFKNYSYIKENPLKYLGSESTKFQKALAEYFLKNPQVNL